MPTPSALSTRKSNAEITSSSTISAPARWSSGSSFQRALSRPCRSAGSVVGSTSATFRRLLAKEPLGAEHQDQDQDREDDGLRPVGARHVPREALVPRLDQSDRDCPEHRTRKVP